MGGRRHWNCCLGRMDWDIGTCFWCVSWYILRLTLCVFDYYYILRFCVHDYYTLMLSQIILCARENKVLVLPIMFSSKADFCFLPLSQLLHPPKVSGGPTLIPAILASNPTPLTMPKMISLWKTLIMRLRTISILVWWTWCSSLRIQWRTRIRKRKIMACVLLPRRGVLRLGWNDQRTWMWRGRSMLRTWREVPMVRQFVCEMVWEAIRSMPRAGRCI